LISLLSILRLMSLLAVPTGAPVDSDQHQSTNRRSDPTWTLLSMANFDRFHQCCKLPNPQFPGSGLTRRNHSIMCFWGSLKHDILPHDSLARRAFSKKKLEKMSPSALYELYRAPDPRGSTVSCLTLPFEDLIPLGNVSSRPCTQFCLGLFWKRRNNTPQASSLKFQSTVWLHTSHSIQRLNPRTWSRVNI